MKAWLVLLGILLAGGAAFLLLETTTRGETHYASSHSCGLGPEIPRWPDVTLPEPDVAYERAFTNGEVVRITFPTGPYRSVIESDGAYLEGWRMRGSEPRLDEDGCALAPFQRAFVGIGDGVASVKMWLWS